MAEKIVLTDRALKAMKPAPGGKRAVTWDAVQPHLGIRVTDTGAKSFVVVKRITGIRAPVVHVLGGYPALELAEARKRARTVLDQITRGVDPKKFEKAKREEARQRDRNNFEAIAKTFVAKHVSKNRKAQEVERIVERYLVPTFGDRQIADIKRREIADLLDDIEKGQFRDRKGRMLGGPVMADHVLATLRKLMNWYAARDDDFISPIVRGMARTKPSERARDRVLTDDEIRALWTALEAEDDSRGDEGTGSGPFTGLVRMLLLTAQRREEVAQMRRPEISGDGLWTIPAERYKTKRPNTVPLSAAARMVIETQPRVDGSDLVFSTNGKTPFSGFGKAKRRLDGAMLEGLRKMAAGWEGHAATVVLLPWRLHDLRRTAKTLMIRAGVRPDISERASAMQSAASKAFTTGTITWPRSAKRWRNWP